MSGNIKGILNWFSQYIIPLLLLLFLDDKSIDWELFACTVLLIYDLYEVGYIQNDAETIKRETNPTLRLRKFELEYYESYKNWIYISRLIIGIFLAVILESYFRVSIFVIIGIWLILLVYQLYNYLRNGWIYVLHVILMELRYIIPLIACGINLSIGLIMIVTVMYPLPSIIVKLFKKRVANSLVVSKYLGNYTTRYKFVVKYYLMALIIGSLFNLLLRGHLDVIFIGVMVYYLFRSILFYFVFGRERNE